MANRFDRLAKEGSEFSNLGKRLILIDRVTGVNYLCINGKALTVLVDSYGKPLTGEAEKYNMREGKRFVRIQAEGSEFSEAGRRVIFADRVTGVCYLMVNGGYGLSVTPLLGADGKPVTMIVPNEA